MSQTTYSNSMLATLYPGVLFDLSPMRIESRVSAESSAEIPFGTLVKSDGSEFGVLKTTSAFDEPQGIVVHSHAYDRLNDLGTTGIKPKVKVAVLRKGIIWVAVEETVLATSRAFFNVTTQLFRVSSGATTIDLTGKSYYRKLYSGSSGLVTLEVDFTNKP